MKAIITLTLLAALGFFTGCKRLDYENPTVFDYVTSLKAGTYSLNVLPEFKSSDIPGLLAYRNDTTIIHNFPVNPISSYAMVECKLGLYVLWTIESIRVSQGGNNPYIARFPSQNPVLALKKDPSVWIFDNESNLEAADAYYKWWISFSFFTNKMDIDPLNNTKYVWH